MSNKLNILINKITAGELSCWYKKQYKNWDKYYLSDEYNLDIDYIIQQFKNDILGRFKKDIENLATDEMTDDDLRDELIIWNNNYDNTFEYISKCYDANLYYPNHFSINWILDLFELKDDNTTILK